MAPARARSDLIQRAAALVVDAFDDYNARFSDITRRARRRFERREWDAHRRDARARIGLYDECITETIGRLEALLAERLLSRTLSEIGLEDTLTFSRQLSTKPELEVELKPGGAYHIHL